MPSVLRRVLQPKHLCDELFVQGPRFQTLATDCDFLVNSTDVPAAYGLFATFYDEMIGKRFFRLLRRHFEKLVQRRCIRFSSVADLGCGTGLFAKHLFLSRNIPVFGVDNSPAMLRIAARRCKNTGVTLLKQDIREFQLPISVDLVTANFDSINYVLEPFGVQQLLRRVFHSLRPGGHFIFDFVTPCQQKSAARVFVKLCNSRRVRVVQNMRWHEQQRLFSSRVFITGLSFLPSVIENHIQRAYRPQEIASWLSDAGFVLRDVVDAATLKSPTICPKRLIVVAQRPAR